MTQSRGRLKCVTLLVCAVMMNAASVRAESVKLLDLAQYNQLLCTHLAVEAERVANDHGDLAVYLSPFIAQELYDRVVAQTTQRLVAEGHGVPTAPRIANLPCGNTVDQFMMAIKGRMELGMAIDVLKEARPYLILFGLILVLWFVFRLYRVRLDAVDADEDDIREQDLNQDQTQDQSKPKQDP